MADYILTVDSHPLLDVAAFVTEFDRPLAELPSPAELLDQLSLTSSAPLQSDDAVREAVRKLLRWGGFKPTGRSKPASEYLLRAVGDGSLGSINRAVDACNVVSLHSGLPISVIDVELALPPWRIAIAPAETTYVFNPSGQVMDIGGLVCLWDAAGPCANAVKDAQRTKTSGTTVRTLSVIWGTQALAGRAAATESWYRRCLESLGGKVVQIVGR